MRSPLALQGVVPSTLRTVPGAEASQVSCGWMYTEGAGKAVRMAGAATPAARTARSHFAPRCACRASRALSDRGAFQTMSSASSTERPATAGPPTVYERPGHRAPSAATVPDHP